MIEQIKIDYTRDALLTEAGRSILEDRYMLPHEKSPQEAFARAAVAFSDSPEMAQRIYDYASRQWFMFSTPILSNAPVRKTWRVSLDDAYDWNAPFYPENFEPSRGLPISCFMNYVPDSLQGIGGHWIENMYLASRGGGIGGHYSDLRSDGTSTSRGSQSNGIIPFIKVVDSEMSAVSQGKTRRGSYAAYLDISHPEIEEFITIRKPTGGDLNRKALNIHHGVNITDEFMRIIERCQMDPNADDSWDLIDPHTKQVVKTVSARRLWESILETRMQTGEPYIAFIDRINEQMPEPLKQKGLQARGSNLCSEITLPTSEDRTAVCCLSSVNLAKYHEWEGYPNFIPDLIRFLDNVLEFFILNAPPEMEKAVRSAAAERSLGLGAMGFHTFLQYRRIPFDSALAKSMNMRIFRYIKEEAVEASQELAKERGEYPDGIGSGMRNAHLLAIAPNASSSIICGGVSPSIEPMRANAFIQKTMSGTFTIKNQALVSLLEDFAIEKFYELPDADGLDADEWQEKWLEEQWRSIIRHKGSVQHLDYLADSDKEIFKTAMEIDQRWLVSHAADRTPFICQSQSVNLFLPPDVDVVELHGLHYMAWAMGLKTLYYLRSEAVKRAEEVSAKIERKNIGHFTEETCLSCEG